MCGYFILGDNNEPIPASALEWGQCIENHRRVGLDCIGKVEVSTVFLGIDHRMIGTGPPVLWETMIFGDSLSEEQERYTSHKDALAGHARWVKKIKEQ